MRKPHPIAGITLLELLVVLAIIAVLLGLTIPAVARVRDAANRVTCTNNLRQIGLALHGYHDTSRNFPPGMSFQGGKAPQPRMSWNTRLLPHLEQEPLWTQIEQAFAQEKFILVNPPHSALGIVLPVFGCPADNRTRRPFTLGQFKVAFTSYLGVEGVDQVRKDGLLYLDSRTRLADITDGTSHTLLVGERPPQRRRPIGLVVRRGRTIEGWVCGHGTWGA